MAGAPTGHHAVMRGRRRPLPLLAALFLLASLVATGRAAAQPAGGQVDEAAYWRLVVATRDRLRGLAELPPEVQADERAALAGEWTTVTAVRRADGRTSPVDHTWLIRRLQAPGADAEAVAQALDALLAGRDAWPATSSPADARETLATILNSPDFQYDDSAEPSAIRRFLNRIWYRVLGALDRVAGGILNNQATSFVGAALLAVVIFLALYNLLSEFISEGRLPAEDDGDEFLTAESALARAKTLSRGGDYRTAVRYLYLSTLLRLEERGIIHYDRTRTNREYLRSVAGQPELALVLHDVVDVFDRVWYGFQPLSEEAYARYEAQVERLRAVRVRSRGDAPGERRSGEWRSGEWRSGERRSGERR